MVIQSLSHQFQRQRVRHAAGFLQLGALVLEPDLDLRLVKSELGGEPLTALLGEVAAGVELSPQDGQLITVECRPRSLVLRATAAAFARGRRQTGSRRTTGRVALAASGLARPRSYKSPSDSLCSHTIIQALQASAHQRRT